MGGLIYAGAKDMTDPMHVNTVNDTTPSKYAGDHIHAKQSVVTKQVADGYDG